MVERVSIGGWAIPVLQLTVLVPHFGKEHKEENNH